MPISCERCGAAANRPCVMVRCSGACSASQCDERWHDHELEIAMFHQDRMRAERATRRA